MADTSKYQLDSDRPPPRSSSRPLSMGISFGIGLTLMLVTGASAQVPDGRGPDTASRVQPSRDQRCRVLSSAFIAKAKKQLNKDYTLLRVEAFYSPVLDACIHAEIAEVGVYANIRDLSYTFIREDPAGMLAYCRNQGWESCFTTDTLRLGEILLTCDLNGANSVLVDRVRKYRGFVDTLQGSEYMDDGFGGPPATIKTPEKPYTKEQCALLYCRWIGYLRGGPRSSRR